MNTLSGFGITGFVLFVAVISVMAIMYEIQSRSNEILYYKELSKLSTQLYQETVFCGGPQKLECSSDRMCFIAKNAKKGIGRCLKS